MEGVELEVKYYIKDNVSLENKVLELGGVLTQARTHELNLRFDTQDKRMTRDLQVLRLRQDVVARMTFKGPMGAEDGVRVRQEIEFTVSDFDAARKLLQALGFQISIIYEKYRTDYFLEGTHISLDELPYGYFLEIEGPDTHTIKDVNRSLGLDWEARIMGSYIALFYTLMSELELKFRDLMFENFAGMEITPAQLGVKPADLP